MAFERKTLGYAFAGTTKVFRKLSRSYTILSNLNLKRSILEPVTPSWRQTVCGARWGWLGKARRKLIISDVEMSDGSGFDFVQLVKADPRLSRIPFIFVTATHCMAAARLRGLALGAARFLFRPLEPGACSPKSKRAYAKIAIANYGQRFDC